MKLEVVKRYVIARSDDTPTKKRPTEFFSGKTRSGFVCWVPDPDTAKGFATQREALMEIVRIKGRKK